jgi:hypothetical protein
MNIGPLHILALVNLGLAGGLASLWVDHNAQPLPELIWRSPEAVSPEIAAPQLALMTDPQAGNPSAYPEILARPIFAADRRPPPPPAPPKPPVQPPPPPPPDPFASVNLTGLFSGANGGVLASVEGKMRRVKIGQQIGAWTLESIDGREATFKRGEQERKLRLAYAKLNVPVPVPVPAAVPNVPGRPAATPQALPANVQEEQRERLRRRNELRTRNGLPPLTE